MVVKGCRQRGFVASFVVSVHVFCLSIMCWEGFKGASPAKALTLLSMVTRCPLALQSCSELARFFEGISFVFNS